MRVLHVFKTYWPDTFGGVERVIFELCENTADLGVRADVLSLSTDPTNGELVAFHRHRRASFRQDLHVASTGLSFPFFMNFKRFAQEYDLIHYHFPWPFMDLVHWLRRIEIPFVVTYHSDIVQQRNLRGAYAPLMNWFLSHASAVVATSQNYVQTSAILRQYDPLVVPLGLSEKHYPEPAMTERVGNILAEPSPYVLTVGVNRHYKGFDTLLRASSSFDGRIVIASAGNRAHDLAEKARRLGAGNVVVLVDATEAEKMALLEGCRAFVFPSDNRAEAYGLSLVEAAMAGRPMISCDIGTGTSFVNIHGETGYVVPAGDISALNDAMRRFVENPDDARRLGRAARKRYESELTGEVMGRRYVDIYRLAMQGNAARYRQTHSV